MWFRGMSGIFATVLAIAGIIFLIFPRHTESLNTLHNYSNLSAGFIGAGCLGGALYFGLITTGIYKFWAQIRSGLRAGFALQLSLLSVIATHYNQLSTTTFVYALWAFLCLGILSVLGIGVYKSWNKPVPPTNTPYWLAYCQGLLGLAFVIIGSAMLIMPTHIMSVWPWRMTLISTQTIGSWVIMSGVLGLSLAFEKRIESWMPTTYAQLIATLLLIISLALSFEELYAGIPMWIYVATLMGIVVFQIVTLFVKEIS